MTACQHLTRIGVDNRCDQWPDRPKFIADRYRASVCVAKSGRGCVWHPTSNPDYDPGPVAPAAPRYKSTPAGMSLRAVSVLFGHKSSEDWPRRWVDRGWLHAERTTYAYRIRRDDLLAFVTVPDAWPSYAIDDILDEDIRDAARAARLAAGAPLTGRDRISPFDLSLQTRHDWTPELEARLLRLREQRVSWQVISRDMGIPATTLQRRHGKLAPAAGSGAA